MTKQSINARFAPIYKKSRLTYDVRKNVLYILWKHGDTKSLRLGVKYLSLLQTGHCASSS